MSIIDIYRFMILNDFKYVTYNNVTTSRKDIAKRILNI
jgi:hypothetical protein